jgi:hypothetical protein
MRACDQGSSSSPCFKECEIGWGHISNGSASRGLPSRCIEGKTIRKIFFIFSKATKTATPPTMQSLHFPWFVNAQQRQIFPETGTRDEYQQYKPLNAASLDHWLQNSTSGQISFQRRTSILEESELPRQRRQHISGVFGPGICSHTSHKNHTKAPQYTDNSHSSKQILRSGTEQTTRS